MKYSYILKMFALLLMTQQASAQTARSKNAYKAQIVKNYSDSLTILRHQLDSLQKVNQKLVQESTDGRYFRLFAPTTFYHSGAQKALSLYPESGDDVADAIDKALLSLYMRRPDLVKNNESCLLMAGTLRDDVNKEVVQQVELVEKVAPVPDLPEEEAPLAVEVTQFLEIQVRRFVAVPSELCVRQLAQGWRVKLFCCRLNNLRTEL